MVTVCTTRSNVTEIYFPICYVACNSRNKELLFYKLSSQVEYFVSNLKRNSVFINRAHDGFGGLAVRMLASGTRVRGFNLGRSRWIFRASEKSSACLPSEGTSHVPALRHVKEPSTSVNYDVLAKFLV